MKSIAEQIVAYKAEKILSLQNELRPISLVSDIYQHDILDVNQRFAVSCALEGRSFIIHGPAGSGKSLTIKTAVKELLLKGGYRFHDYKIKGAGKKLEPGIAVCAFTNAVKTMLRDLLLEDEYIRKHIYNAITTIHLLLEYNLIKGFGFLPQRNENNPLNCTTIIIDELSNVDWNLLMKLYEACPNDIQWILVGDLSQIPPAFGQSSLHRLIGYLPVVTLEYIYRQSETNPLIQEAQNVLQGIAPKQNVTELHTSGDTLGLVIPKNLQKHPRFDSENIKTLAKFFGAAYHNGIYDPMTDMIICPFRTPNRLISCHTLNALIAGMTNQGNLIYQIIAGKDKTYMSIGDIIFVHKERALVMGIEDNPNYEGEAAVDPQYVKNYMGDIKEGYEYEYKMGKPLTELMDLDDEEAINARPLSHIITVRYMTGDTEDLYTTDDLSFDELSLGYATTFHKSQGSQWRKAFVIAYACHGKMMNKEMLYTAITRAKEMTVLMCDDLELIHYWVRHTCIPGNSIEEKLLYLKRKFSLDDINLSKLAR